METEPGTAEQQEWIMGAFKNLEWMDYWTAVHMGLSHCEDQTKAGSCFIIKLHGAGGSGKLSEPRAGKSIPGENDRRSISDMGEQISMCVWCSVWGLADLRWNRKTDLRGCGN